jgi:adenylate cyclase
MFSSRNINFTSWVGYGGNLPEFQQSAANAGHFNPFTDPDGIVRRVPMIAELDGAFYEALSLAVVRTLLGFPKLEPGYTETGFMQGGYSGLEWLRTGPLTIPVDESVCALVPFRGDRYSFPYISIADILADRVSPAQLKGRIALVGASASGLLDLRATPVNSVYAGVEVHANMIAGILDRKIPQKPPVHARRRSDAARRHRTAARDHDPDAVRRVGDAVVVHRACRGQPD